MTTKVTSSDHCGSPDELRKWVQKDRMGTHWVGCEKSHKDCAILKAADAWKADRKRLLEVERAAKEWLSALEEIDEATGDDVQSDEERALRRLVGGKP